MKGSYNPAGCDLPLDTITSEGMLPLILVRHGQTEMNRARCFVGKLDVDLDEVGRLQAAALARRLASLDLGAIYSSPLRRAMDTAAALGVPEPVEALAELDQGLLEGQPESTLSSYPEFSAAWASDPANVMIPGGESLAMLQARMVSAMDHIASAHVPPGPVLVVSHQMAIACFLCSVMGLTLDRFREVTCKNGALNLLGWRDGSWATFTLDDVRHL